MLANKRDPVLPVGHGLGGVSEGRDVERFVRAFGERFLNGSAIFTLQVISIFYLGSVTGWLDVTHTEYTFSTLLHSCISSSGYICGEVFYLWLQKGTCECLNGINCVNRMQIIFSLAKDKVQSRVFHRIISWSFHNGG